MPPHILHLSDLHFGTDHGFRMPDQAHVPGEIEVDIADAIADDLELQEIGDFAAMIISGDLMTHARWVDYGIDAYKVLTKLCRRIRLERERVFIVPGNHDYEWYIAKRKKMVRKALRPQRADEAAVNFGHQVQFTNFLRQFHGENAYQIPSVRIVQLPDYALKIGLLDSCKISATKFHEYGYLSLGQIKVLMENFQGHLQRREVRAIVLHHHVTSIIPAEPPTDEPSISVTLDAARLLDHSLSTGISFFLHGHQHYPCVTRINKSHQVGGAITGLAEHDTYVLSAGSASVKRTRLMQHIPNTYSLITLLADIASVRIRQIYSNGTQGSTYLEKEFPLFVLIH